MHDHIEGDVSQKNYDKHGDDKHGDRRVNGTNPNFLFPLWECLSPGFHIPM